MTGNAPPPPNPASPLLEQTVTQAVDALVILRDRNAPVRSRRDAFTTLQAIAARGRFAAWLQLRGAGLVTAAARNPAAIRDGWVVATALVAAGAATGMPQERAAKVSRRLRPSLPPDLGPDEVTAAAAHAAGARMVAGRLQAVSDPAGGTILLTPAPTTASALGTAQLGVPGSGVGGGPRARRGTPPRR